ETLYSSTGQDQINLFNGSLSYRIPLGEPIAVGPSLKLAALLTYNTSYMTTWMVDEGRNPNTGEEIISSRQVPSGDRTVGTGWQLQFGRLISTRQKMVVKASNPANCNSTLSASLMTQATSSSFPDVGMFPTGWGFQEADGSVHEFYDRFAEASGP